LFSEKNIALGTTGYIAVADAYAQRGDVQTVRTLLSELQAQLPSPTPHVQLVLLSLRMKACISANRFQSALQILEDEVSHPDTTVFNMMVSAALRTDNTSSILRTLRALEDKGFPTSEASGPLVAAVMRRLGRTINRLDDRLQKALLRAARRRAVEESGDESGAWE